VFPKDARAPISYGHGVKAFVAYLPARQHLPGRRVADTMADCFGLNTSTGTIDAVYSEASRKLKGFIVAPVAFLKTLTCGQPNCTGRFLGASEANTAQGASATYATISPPPAGTGSPPSPPFRRKALDAASANLNICR
jgi:hypothetical protein